MISRRQRHFRYVLISDIFEYIHFHGMMGSYKYRHVINFFFSPFDPKQSKHSAYIKIHNDIILVNIVPTAAVSKVSLRENRDVYRFKYTIRLYIIYLVLLLSTYEYDSIKTYFLLYTPNIDKCIFYSLLVVTYIGHDISSR